MIGYLLRWMVILSGVFLLPVLLIRAQPYDDSGLRAFLTPPEGCPAPCFMGIRPGVTTLDEMSTILNQHAWVVPGTLEMGASGYFGGDAYFWKWTDTAPVWIPREVDSAIVANGDIVSLVNVRTTMRWGDVLLAFGWPDKYEMKSVYDTPEMSPFEYMHFGWYQDLKLLVFAGGYCWLDPMYEWSSDLTFQPDIWEFSVSSLPPMLTCR